MRGKPNVPVGNQSVYRITPACAGKTIRAVLKSVGLRDHPRMCGENTQLILNTIPTPGSPPHVRGKPDGLYENHTSIRITPACAGKTCNLLVLIWGDQDHPRMCGENIDNTIAPTGTLGSPPHVRGKLALNPARHCDTGITPACAGKTPSNDLVAVSWRDHPRMCGENRW